MRKKKVGLFGGTFDPVHNGHLYIAAYIKENYNIDEIVLMPTFRPPHKSIEKTSSYEDRFNMLNIAIKNDDYFQISTLEKDLDQEVSYSVDVVEEMLKRVPDIDVYFILGSDSLFDIEQWKYFQKLLSSVTIVCFSREYHKEQLKKYIYYLEQEYEAIIFLIDNMLIDVSSTHIRSEIQKGNKSVRFLLPENVLQYINEQGLYTK